MALKDWTQTKKTAKSEKWSNKKDSEKLVHVYQSDSYGGKKVWTFFARLSEPQYVDDDEYGKNVFSQSFDTKPQAINEAKNFMRKH